MVVISARKADELDAAVENLKRDRGVTAVRVIGDLSRAENVNPFVDAVAAAAGAPIDILVNNAGATWVHPPRSIRSRDGTRCSGSISRAYSCSRSR